ncbi:MAG: rod shape-determining protein MreC [Acidimicrobiia bacterium]|nr:rod shape-determining protein MreC [Acidimicrobiia bacterium]
MAVYRRSTRHRFLLVLLVLTSITVITVDVRGGGSGSLESLRRAARDAFAPVQSTADDVINPVSDFFGGLFRYGHLKAENAQLRRQLADARGRVNATANDERERQELLALQKLSFADTIPAVAARVVATSPSNFQLTVEIDRGLPAGIQKGMPVVTGAGLVGRVAAVSQERATVLLLTDPSFNVGIRLSGSGDVGVARGNGIRQPLPVDLVDVGTKVSGGEVVVTSGLQGSVFPADIPVGKVRSAKVDPGSLQQQVSIDPLVDLSRLDFVKVLIWTPPAAMP